MAAMDTNEKIMWWTIAGLIIFWAIALPTIIWGPKPWGAGPQPTSTGGGSGS